MDEKETKAMEGILDKIIEMKASTSVGDLCSSYSTLVHARTERIEHDKGVKG